MPTTTITVRFFAAARAATGVDHVDLELPTAAPTLAMVESGLAAQYDDLEPVLPRCSYLVNEIAVHDRGARIAAAAVVDVLPPFAGG